MADDEMRCSFCGKTRSQVRKLIQGPNHVYICDECVKTCEDIIKEADRAEADFREAEEPQFAPAAPIKELPTPHEIYNELSQYVMGQEEAKRAMARTTRSEQCRDDLIEHPRKILPQLRFPHDDL